MREQLGREGVPLRPHLCGTSTNTKYSPSAAKTDAFHNIVVLFGVDPEFKQPRLPTQEGRAAADAASISFEEIDFALIT